MPPALHIPTMKFDPDARIAYVDMDSREPWDVQGWIVAGIVGPDPADVLVWLDGDDTSDLTAFLAAKGNAETHKVENGRIVPRTKDETDTIEAAKLPALKSDRVQEIETRTRMLLADKMLKNPDDLSTTIKAMNRDESALVAQIDAATTAAELDAITDERT